MIEYIKANGERSFWIAVGVSLAVKFVLAAWIPMTSDEAYFALWGRYPDYGYYDHPPMVGFVLWFMQLFGSSEAVVRLPPIIFSTLIGVLIFYCFRALDEKKAALIALLFILSPLNMLNVLITTDAPLLICSFLSALFLYKALRTDSYLSYILSGVMLGAAFLSKYFAVLLAFSFFVYWLCSRKTKHNTIGLGILFLAATPFVAMNVYWNYTHCLNNVMFNLFNRNANEEFSLLKPLAFIACQIYLLTPPFVYYIFKKRAALASSLSLSLGGEARSA
ncbi:MAG: glycosyltransferase family 39 protein [Helicobacteraceae bacterium]|jgi:4-amino-4-deoxy-L-arabinose transferase-like glycosyltransferase|nr:glycosyltransferase family 39 protein [Helicobacteraceae bacterium]